MRRRVFLQAGLAAVGGAVVLAGCSDGGSTTAGSGEAPWLMPDEGSPHERTWMAFAADPDIWGADLVPQVHADLARIATTIARYEPVSMLVSDDDLPVAQRLLGDANVTLVPADFDDLWIRDSGPTFVSRNTATAGVDFNFNGWGDKQPHERDAKVASFVTAHAGVPTLHTDLVLEGGALEVDGQGTAIITESCVLNKNRNPG